jgi:hypothetical protein
VVFSLCHNKQRNFSQSDQNQNSGNQAKKILRCFEKSVVEMQQRRKLFCEYRPICYRIAAEKECLRRDCTDWLRRRGPFGRLSRFSVQLRAR